MSDGQVVVPMIWPKVLADLLAAFAQAGFTFQVEADRDAWVVKLSR
jgi:hypothetical protein